MVTVPALLVLPGAMVRVLPDRVKSDVAADPAGLAATVMVVATAAVKFWVAVTVAAPPFSAMDVWDRDSVTVGVSSSVMVRVTALAAGSEGWAVLAVVAVTLTDLLAARRLLLLAVMVTVPALVVAPAAMVSVLPDRV